MQRLMWIGTAVWMAAAALSAAAQNKGLEGNWRTPTGSVINVTSCGDAFCLKIAQIEKGSPYTKDGLNPDPALKSRPLCGLEIGTGFIPDATKTKAEKGHIYDPKSGRTYSGSIMTEGPDKLKLRGYIGAKLFGRTEEWTRTAEPVESCR